MSFVNDFLGDFRRRRVMALLIMGLAGLYHVDFFRNLFGAAFEFEIPNTGITVIKVMGVATAVFAYLIYQNKILG